MNPGDVTTCVVTGMGNTGMASNIRAVAVAACAILALVTDGSAAEPVTLKSKTGGFEIQGEILSSDGQLLTVRSRMGTVTIPISDVTCTGAGCPPELTEAPAAKGAAMLTIGDGVSGEMVDELLAAFAATSGVTVETVDGKTRYSTSDGTFGVRSGAAFGASPRIEFRAPSAGSRELALDPVVAVTSPLTRPGSLTLRGLGNILTGRAANWAEFGGRSAGITPVLPTNDPAVETIVSELTRNAGLAASVERVEDVAAHVLSNPGSIGLTRSSARGALRATPISGECGLSSVPSGFAVRTGQYPLYSVLTFAGDRSDPAIAAFLDFIASDEGQSIVTQHSLVGRDITRADAAWLEDWIASASKLAEFDTSPAARRNMRALVESTTGATRLSVTLRYPFGNAAPDAARDDFARLAEAIGSGEFDGNTVIFAGFVDERNRLAGSQAASTTAAERVLADFTAAFPELRDHEGVDYEAVGYGRVAPLQCSTTPAERRVNDRVEVWLRPK